METKFSELTSLIEKLSAELKDINTYKKECSDKLSLADKTIIDIQHCLEFEKLDAVELVKIALRLKKAIIERRQYKNELDLINSITTADGNIGNTITRLNLVKDSYSKQLQVIGSMKYFPRADASLFSPEHVYKPGEIKPSTKSSNGGRVLTYTDSKGNTKTIYRNRNDRLDAKLKQISEELSGKS